MKSALTSRTSSLIETETCMVPPLTGLRQYAVGLMEDLSVRSFWNAWPTHF